MVTLGSRRAAGLIFHVKTHRSATAIILTALFVAVAGCTSSGSKQAVHVPDERVKTFVTAGPASSTTNTQTVATTVHAVAQTGGDPVYFVSSSTEFKWADGVSVVVGNPVPSSRNVGWSVAIRNGSGSVFHATDMNIVERSGTGFLNVDKVVDQPDDPFQFSTTNTKLVEAGDGAVYNIEFALLNPAQVALVVSRTGFPTVVFSAPAVSPS